MRTICTSKQSGFATLTMILVAVVLIGVLAGAMAITRTSGTQASDTVKPVAAAIIAQGGNLAAGFQILESRGVPASSVTFDATATTGLFNPSNGAASIQLPPVTGCTAQTNCYWQYKTNKIAVPSVGTGIASYGFVLPAVSLSVCQAINTQLWNSAPSATPPSSGLASMADVSATLPLGPQVASSTESATAFSLSAGAPGTGFTGTIQGCAKNTDGTYFYYVIAEPQ